jgi:hypothetical protein
MDCPSPSTCTTHGCRVVSPKDASSLVVVPRSRRGACDFDISTYDYPRFRTVIVQSCREGCDYDFRANDYPWAFCPSFHTPDWLPLIHAEHCNANCLGYASEACRVYPANDESRANTF